MIAAVYELDDFSLAPAVRHDSLVGLRAPYIAGQLTRWRVGERHAAEPDCMRRVATRLTESDIAAVAAWLSQQDAPKDPSPESSNLVRMPWACGSQR